MIARRLASSVGSATGKQPRCQLGGAMLAAPTLPAGCRGGQNDGLAGRSSGVFRTFAVLRRSNSGERARQDSNLGPSA